MSLKTRFTGAVAGAVAGAVGTAAMDALWYRRYLKAGGKPGIAEWEFGAKPESWDEAPAPAKVAKLAIETAKGTEVPIEQAQLLTNVMHWSYGIGWGALYGASGRGAGFSGTLFGAALFGPLVWSSDYALLPVLKIYKPIWEYDSKTLADDLTAHVVYGAGTALAYRALS